VEILKKKYNLGDIINFKVIELDQNKKRYVLDIYNNNNTSSQISEYVKDNNQEISTTSLNVCEKSFYPRSYLKLVEGNNNNINNSNNNNGANTNNNAEYTKPTSLYDLLNSKDNNYVISVNVNSFSSTTNNNNNHNINYKKINNTNIEKSNYNKKK
jgi:hypothetical protein